MRNIFHLFVLLQLFTSTTFGQITFQKIYCHLQGQDHEPITVKQTYDEGYIIACSNDVGDTIATASLVRTNKYGDTLWIKHYFAQPWSLSRGAQQTADSGFIFVGDIGNRGIYLLKTDNNGDTLWTKTYSNTFGEGMAVQQTFDAGYIIVGEMRDSSNNIITLLVKTDINGNVTWQKRFGNSLTPFFSLYVQQTNDSGYAVLISTYNGICLIKTNSNGDTTWTKSYNISIFRGSCIQQTKDNGYVMVVYGIGGYSGSASIIKTDSFGNIQWSKAYGDSAHYRGANTVWQTYDNGYAIAGYSADTGNFFGLSVYLIKTDNIGDTIWTREYGKDFGNIAYSVQQTKDSGYIVAGSTKRENLYLIKTDANGNSGCREYNSPTSVSTIIDSAFAVPLSVSSQNFIGYQPFIIVSGDTVATLCSSVGINEIYSGNHLTIYPNPSNGTFHILLNENIKQAILNIYNTLGQKLYSEPFHGKASTITKPLKEGIYYIQLVDNNQSITQKIIIE